MPPNKFVDSDSKPFFLDCSVYLCSHEKFAKIVLRPLSLVDEARKREKIQGQTKEKEDEVNKEEAKRDDEGDGDVEKSQRFGKGENDEDEV